MKLRALFLLTTTLTGTTHAAVVLTPGSYHAAAGEQITLKLTAPASDKPAWPADPAWFFVRLGGTQENRGQGDAPTPDPAGLVRTTLALPGVAMIGIDLAPRPETWTPAVLTGFAARAGQPDACPAADATVEVLKSATTLVLVRPADDAPAPPDTTATSKSGQHMEIRPLMNPTTLAPGSDLPVRLYMQGEAAPNCEVRAINGDRNPIRVVTDDKGIAMIRIDRAGAWRLEADVLRPLTNAPTAWRAGSVTLTFQTPAAEEAP